jgi:hypothetical protein
MKMPIFNSSEERNERFSIRFGFLNELSFWLANFRSLLTPWQNNDCGLHDDYLIFSVR